MGFVFTKASAASRRVASGPSFKNEKRSWHDVPSLCYDLYPETEQLRVVPPSRFVSFPFIGAQHEFA